MKRLNVPEPSNPRTLSKNVSLIEFSDGSYGIRFGLIFYDYLDFTVSHNKSTLKKNYTYFRLACTRNSYAEVLEIYNSIKPTRKESKLTDTVLRNC